MKSRSLPRLVRAPLSLAAALWIASSSVGAIAQTTGEPNQHPAGAKVDESALIAAEAAAPSLGAGEQGGPGPGEGGLFVEGSSPLDRSYVVRVIGEPKGPRLVGKELERRTYEIGLLLRCTVCQGSAISDSPSPTAINMKNEVRDLLRQGFDQPQILAWFEESYGQFVLMEPKAEGLNLVVWFGPVLVLLAGLAFVFIQLRKPDPTDDLGDTGEEALAGGRQLQEHLSATGEEPTNLSRLPKAETPPLDPELDAYLREVRELAYGADDAEPRPGGKGRNS